IQRDLPPRGRSRIAGAIRSQNDSHSCSRGAPRTIHREACLSLRVKTSKSTIAQMGSNHEVESGARETGASAPFEPSRFPFLSISISTFFGFSVGQALRQRAGFVLEEDLDLLRIEDARHDAVAEFRVADEIAFRERLAHSVLTELAHRLA